MSAAFLALLAASALLAAANGANDVGKPVATLAGARIASYRSASWLKVAASRAVVRRALAYAFGVGALLIAINHGDAILAGRVDAVRVLRMVLTVLVPYCVSTASSAGAMLENRPRDAGEAEENPVEAAE